MTDTSPAAIKAWALESAANLDEAARWCMSKDIPHDAAATAAARFRAVAALADLATGGDAQREEDAADPRRFPTIWPGRVRFTFESDETSFYVEADNSSPEARAFMFDDFVKSLQERTDIARARPGWREGVEAAAAVAKRAKDHRFDCCARGQPDEMSLHGHRSAAYEAEEIEAAIRALKEPT